MNGEINGELNGEMNGELLANYWHIESRNKNDNMRKKHYLSLRYFEFLISLRYFEMLFRVL